MADQNTPPEASRTAPEAPKIVVDSDWKSQARAEKERLAAAEREAAKKKQVVPASPAGGGSLAPGAEGGEAYPEESPFGALVGTLATHALMYLGAFPDPQSGRAVVSLEHAKFQIDLLTVLEEKTAGNLTPEESKELAQTLHELRLRYVEISKAVVAMAAKQRATEGTAGGMGGGMGGGQGGGHGGPGVPASIPNLRVTQ